MGRLGERPGDAAVDVPEDVVLDVGPAAGAEFDRAGDAPLVVRAFRRPRGITPDVAGFDVAAAVQPPLAVVDVVADEPAGGEVVAPLFAELAGDVVRAEQGAVLAQLAGVGEFPAAGVREAVAVGLVVGGGAGDLDPVERRDDDGAVAVDVGQYGLERRRVTGRPAVAAGERNSWT